jgi:hypothetical protein
MGKTTVTAATAALLFNLCTSSYGQELSPVAEAMNNQRRSLRSGMAAEDDEKKKGEPDGDVKFHTKILTTTKKKAAPQQNPFYDLDAFTPKEVSSYDKRPPAKTVHGFIQ